MHAFERSGMLQHCFIRSHSPLVGSSAVISIGLKETGKQAQAPFIPSRSGGLAWAHPPSAAHHSKLCQQPRPPADQFHRDGQPLLLAAAQPPRLGVAHRRVGGLGVQEAHAVGLPPSAFIMPLTMAPWHQAPVKLLSYHAPVLHAPQPSHTAVCPTQPTTLAWPPHPALTPHLGQAQA